MKSEKIRLLPKPVFVKSVEVSRKMYRFLQRDLKEAVEYVALDRNHLGVYSTRLANLILRSGPEILRLLYLLIFYPREKLAPIEPETTRIMLELQDKIENRRDTFGDYLALCSQRSV